jgi:hypothetical protein
MLPLENKNKSKYSTNGQKHTKPNGFQLVSPEDLNSQGK